MSEDKYLKKEEEWKTKEKRKNTQVNAEFWRIVRRDCFSMNNAR